MVGKFRKLLKFIGAILGVVILLAIAAMIALSFIDTNQYKKFVIQQVKSQTGRDLSIAEVNWI